MFDVSFSELMVVGVIALIVIGPERLPKVARTIGHLLGRAQRYVSEVKSDIQQEMDLKELGDIKNQMEEAAQSVKSSMTDSLDELKSAVESPAQELKDSLDEARKVLDTSVTAAPPTAEPATPPAAEPASTADSAQPAQEPAATPQPATTADVPKTPAAEPRE